MHSAYTDVHPVIEASAFGLVCLLNYILLFLSHPGNQYQFRGKLAYQHCTASWLLQIWYADLCKAYSFSRCLVKPALWRKTYGTLSNVNSQLTLQLIFLSLSDRFLVFQSLGREIFFAGIVIFLNDWSDD